MISTSSLALFLQPVSCLWSQILETLILNTSSDVLTLTCSGDSEDAGLPGQNLPFNLQPISPLLPRFPQVTEQLLSWEIQERSPRSPREGCAIETEGNVSSKCLSNQKFSKKTFLKSCVHCCFSRPVRVDGTWWGELSPVTAAGIANKT